MIRSGLRIALSIVRNVRNGRFCPVDEMGMRTLPVTRKIRK
jgi:hypothetical protein